MLFEVAELVHDDIISEFIRQEKKLVGKIEIRLSGTATPHTLRILDRDAFIGVAIKLIPILQALVHNISSLFFVVEVGSSSMVWQHFDVAHALH